MYGRNLAGGVRRALADTPVVFLHGARQSGKTTLARSFVGRRYLTLDDSTVLAAASADPQGLIAGLKEPVVIDEVQRMPELFRAIKLAVDRDRRPGRFLLTGSTSALLLPRLSESLAGRMEVLTLWPLSQGELEGVAEGFLDAVFDGDLAVDGGVRAFDRAEIARRVTAGGFPEVLGRDEADRRAAWFSSYLTTVLERDVRELANIEGLATLPRLLQLLATRSASLLNLSDVGRSLAIPFATLNRYFALLEATFLVAPVPAWTSNLGLRLVKAPKLFLCDSGLAAHLQGMVAERLLAEPDLLGRLLESFVVQELRKQAGWSRTRASVWHFRTYAGREVDAVLEDPTGRLVGIEVKASSTVGAGDFAGLRQLQDQDPRRFVRGLVLYLGEAAVPFGERLHALPVSALWQLGARPQDTGRRP